MEFLLGAWLESLKPARLKGTKKGKPKVPAAMKSAGGDEVRSFTSTGDVLAYGVERLWVASNQ